MVTMDVTLRDYLRLGNGLMRWWYLVLVTPKTIIHLLFGANIPTQRRISPSFISLVSLVYLTVEVSPLKHFQRLIIRLDGALCCTL